MTEQDPHGIIAGTIRFIRRLTWIAVFVFLVVVLTITTQGSAQ
jgi:preprotein translocase subunit SecG